MRFTAIEKFTGPAAIALFAGVIVLYLYRIVTWKPRG
jgi:hypothetical protein